MGMYVLVSILLFAVGIVSSAIIIHTASVNTPTCEESYNGMWVFLYDFDTNARALEIRALYPKYIPIERELVNNPSFEKGNITRLT